MKATINAKLVRKVRKEENWMIIEVTESCEKWVKEEKARRTVDQPIHIFVGKFFFESLKGWKKGEEKEINVLIKTDKKESNAGNEFITYDVEFTGVVLPKGMFDDAIEDDDEVL